MAKPTLQTPPKASKRDTSSKTPKARKRTDATAAVLQRLQETIHGLPCARIEPEDSDTPRINYWAVLPSGDYGKDCLLGEQIARHVIAKMRTDNTPSLFGNIVQAIQTSGQWTGVEAGFCHVFGLAGMNESAPLKTPSSVSVSSDTIVPAKPRKSSPRSQGQAIQESAPSAGKAHQTQRAANGRAPNPKDASQKEEKPRRGAARHQEPARARQAKQLVAEANGRAIRH